MLLPSPRTPTLRKAASTNDSLKPTASTPLPARPAATPGRSVSCTTQRPTTRAEVGPASFTKIKLLGKGDVGKVYLVQQKDNGRLYALKGT